MLRLAYDFVMPLAARPTESVEIPAVPRRCEICKTFLYSQSGSATQPAHTGDRMILWLVSMAGVIAGVFATGPSVSDPEALLLIGMALIGVAVRFRRGKGTGD